MSVRWCPSLMHSHESCVEVLQDSLWRLRGNRSNFFLASWLLVFNWRSDWRLFVWDSTLLFVFLRNVVGSFQTTSELLQRSEGFVEFVDFSLRADLASSKFSNQVLIAWRGGTRPRRRPPNCNDVEIPRERQSDCCGFCNTPSRQIRVVNRTHRSMITKRRVPVNIKLSLSPSYQLLRAAIMTFKFSRFSGTPCIYIYVRVCVCICINRRRLSDTF